MYMYMCMLTWTGNNETAVDKKLSGKSNHTDLIILNIERKKLGLALSLKSPGDIEIKNEKQYEL